MRINSSAMANNEILFLPLKAKWYDMIDSGVKLEEYREDKPYWQKRITDDKKYVRFSYGYTKKTMTFKIKNIRKGIGNPEWGAPSYPVYIIKLGDRI